MIGLQNAMRKTCLEDLQSGELHVLVILRLPAFGVDTPIFVKDSALIFRDGTMLLMTPQFLLIIYQDGTRK